MKGLIILAIIYFVYRHLKEKMLDSIQPSEGSRSEGPESTDDVMIQDPECGVYFPLRDGVPGRIQGKTINFCSIQCRDAYMKKH